MCGKTTIGQAIAEKLSWDFLDTDQAVEKKYFSHTDQNHSCREIYRHHGETAFRDLEKQQIYSLKTYTKHVISLGGGSLMDHENAKLIQDLRIVIYLKASFETLCSRMQTVGIPAYLDVNDPEKSLRILVDQRTPIYEAVSQKTFEIKNFSPNEIADLIMEKVIHGQ